MTTRACYDAIAGAMGRPPTEDEVERIAEAVQERLKRKMQRGMTPREAAREAGKEMTDEAKLRKSLARRDAFNNIQIHAELRARMTAGDEVKSEQALLGGTSKGGRDNANSIDSNTRSLRSALLQPAVVALKKAGLLKALLKNDRDLNLDVARELRRRGDPTLEADTGNAHAKIIAEALGSVLDASRAMQNKAGAFIGNLEGYMGRQYHDMTKVRGEGGSGKTLAEKSASSDRAFQQWHDFIRPLLDMDKMAPDLSDAQIKSMMRGTWNGLASGVHDTATSEALRGYLGSANLGKKVSQGRSIIFNDADSWFKYNEKYGKGSVMDAVFAAADGASRSTAIMTKLGTNPEAMFQRIHDENVERAVKRGDIKTAEALRGDPNKGLLDMVTGKAMVPGNARLAQNFATVRNFMQLKSLGGVLWSALPDVIATSATLRANGIPLFAALTHQLRAILPQGERAQEIAHALGAGIEGMTGHVVNRFRADDGVPGQLTRAVNMFHHLNGLNYWTEAQKVGMGLALSENLARHSGKEFAALHPMMQDTLRRYGIEQAEWDVGRATAAKGADGRHYLMPAEIADAAVSQKFNNYVVDQIAEGLNEPTARSRLVTTQGTKAGTWGGEIVRSMMQFKGFTVAYMQNHLGRVLYRGDRIDYPGFVYLAIGMSLAGLAGNALRDLASNKATAVPTTAGGWGDVGFKAIAGGGAFGVLGDALFRDSSTGSGDVARAFTGPSITALYDAIAAVHSVTSKAHDPSLGSGSVAKTAEKQLMHLLGSYVPNHPVVSAANGFLFGHAMQEIFNPGATQRYNNLLRQQGQHQVLRPALQN